MLHVSNTSENFEEFCACRIVLFNKYVFHCFRNNLRTRPEADKLAVVTAHYCPLLRILQHDTTIPIMKDLLL